MKKFTAFALLFLALSTLAQDRIALVIGNANYQEDPLKSTLNDSNDMAASLEELGFKVTHIQNADKKTIEEAISDFGNQLNRNSVNLFYYSGHGVQHHNENYLLPINSFSAIKENFSELNYRDQRMRLDTEAVSSNRLTNLMSESNSQQNFIFLDACRKNPISTQPIFIEKGLSKNPLGATDTLIAYATGPGGDAEDGKGRNSTYTKHLLKHMDTPNQPIELMLKDVKEAVSIETKGKQLP
ncbi:uncharacterized protein METZ01_LOCUS429835, partial [marine metagenome]